MLYLFYFIFVTFENIEGYVSASDSNRITVSSTWGEYLFF